MSVYIEYVCQVLATILGIIAWRWVRPAFLRWIIPVLIATVLNELVIVPYLVRHFPASRDLAYNLFSLLDMGVWLYVFYRIHAGVKPGRYIIAATVAIYLYSFVEIQIKGWTRLHTDSFRLYEIIILLLACTYLYRIFKMEYHRLMPDPLFWTSAACIIYHAVLFLNFTTLAENSYWYFNGADEVFIYLQAIGNIFYYLFLSFAFIACISSRSQASRMDSYQE